MAFVELARRHLCSLTLNQNRNRGFVIVLVCLATWLGLQQLGYSEFAVAGRILRSGTVQSVLSAQFALEDFEKEICSNISIHRMLGSHQPHLSTFWIFRNRISL